MPPLAPLCAPTAGCPLSPQHTHPTPVPAALKGHRWNLAPRPAETGGSQSRLRREDSATPSHRGWGLHREAQGDVLESTATAHRQARRPPAT